MAGGSQVLMLIGEHSGDPMMANIVMSKALQRHQPKRSRASRRKNDAYAGWR
jgi:hypothetical protein